MVRPEQNVCKVIMQRKLLEFIHSNSKRHGKRHAQTFLSDPLLFRAARVEI